MKKICLIFVFLSFFWCDARAQTRTDSIYLFVDQMPRPSEGFPAYLSKLSADLRYPYGSICIEGRVYISFVVEKNGKLRHFKILKGLDPQVDEASIRVVQEGPSWQPGRHQGKNCRVKVVLPILWKF